MPSNFISRHILFFFFLLPCIFISAARGAEGDRLWSTSVVVDEGNQHAIDMVSDGAGGAIITYLDERNYGDDIDVYVHHMDSQGYHLWQLKVTDDPEDEHDPRIVSDGAGGVIVAWWRHDVSQSFYGTWTVFAQRINSSGAIVWNAGGKAVSSEIAFNVAKIPAMEMESDGSGGAYIAFEGQSGLCVAHIDYAGFLANPGLNGITLGGGAASSCGLSVAPDGHGGVFVAWHNPDILIAVQRVNIGSNPSLPLLSTPWGPDPVLISTDSSLKEWYPLIINDGSDGAFVACQRGKLYSDIIWHFLYDDKIVLQRIDSEGNVLWRAGGISLSENIGECVMFSAAVDGTGGLYFAYQAGSVFGFCQPDIHLVRINADGTMAWPVMSIKSWLEGNSDLNDILMEAPALIADNGAGAVLAADVDAGDEGHIPYVFGIHESGIAWATPASTYGGRYKSNPKIVFDGTGSPSTGPFIAWEDSWFDPDNLGKNIFAAKLEAQYIRPDFTVQSITFEPAFPLADEPFSILVRYGNTGLADVSSLIKLGFNSGALPFSVWEYTNLYGGLDAGETYLLQQDFPAGRAAGIYRVQASINPDDDIRESTQGNNYLEAPLIIYDNPRPDLIIQSIVLDPASPRPNEPFTAFVTVCNQGALAAEPPFSVSYNNGAPNSVTEYWRLSGLAQGACSTFQFVQAGFPAGTYEMYARADTENEVIEAVENNNSRQLSLEIEPMPDLVVESIAVYPSFPQPWEPLAFEVTVKNMGGAPSEVYAGGGLIDPQNPRELLFFMETPPLDAGESFVHHVELQRGRPAGSYQLLAAIDSANEIAETDETNNDLWVSLEIGTCPGDFDHDNDIDGTDAASFAQFVTEGNMEADLDGSRTVGDPGDYDVFARYFGNTECFSTITGYITIEPDIVFLSGNDADIEVSLSEPAPEGGVTVTLQSDDPNIFTVNTPLEISIAQGETSALFSIHGVSPGTAAVHAEAESYRQGSADVRVVAGFISLPEALSLPLSTTVSLPVTISPDPAPAGGLTLTLEASSDDIDLLSPEVFIPEGHWSANFTVRAAIPGSWTVTAGNADYMQDSCVVSTDTAFDIVESEVTFNMGFPNSITVQLESAGAPSAAPSGGVGVALIADDLSCVTVPASVLIPEGQVSVTVPMDYGGGAPLPCSTKVTAAAPDIAQDSVIVNVEPQPAITMPADAKVGAGLEYGAYIVRLGTGDHGGADIFISSSDPGKVLVSPDRYTQGSASITLHLAPGRTTGTFFIQGVERTTGKAEITATSDGFVQDSTVVEVVQPALCYLDGLQTHLTTLSPDDPFQVRVGIPYPNNSTCAMYQYVRISGDGKELQVNVMSSNGDVGLLVTKDGTGKTVHVSIPEGESGSSSSVDQGGVAFKAFGPGTTTVSASLEDFIVAPALPKEITVETPDITMPSNAMVGSGLQYGPYILRLGASEHGGVDVTISSSDDSVALLSPDAATVGSGSITLHIKDGRTTAGFYVQGVDGVTGTTSLNATAAGFNPGSMLVEVVKPAVGITSLSSTITTLSEPDEFQVSVGIPNNDNSAMYQYQPVSVNGDDTGLSATLNNSSAEVARLVTESDSGQQVTVSIAEGMSHSPATVVSGGVSLEPLASGTTTVTVSVPNFISLPAASADVSVSMPVITMPADTRVGSGLQYGPYVLRLGASDHGGIDVAISSSDASVALVSPDSSTVGTGSVTLHIDDGRTTASFYIQGLENTTGTVELIAQAAAFASDSMEVQIVEPAVVIAGLSASTTILTAPDPFQVIVGVLDATGSYMAQYQPVRVSGDGQGISAYVENSNAAVGRLVYADSIGQEFTVTISEGESGSASTVAQGGIAFKALGTGDTTVSVSVPDFVLPAAASQDVSVGVPAVAMPSGTSVGSGLQNGPYVLRLGASEHGGVDVTISTSNDSVALVSPDAVTVGSSSITLHVDNGRTSASFYIQGLENAAGTVAITGDAPGFISDTMSVEIVQPGLMITGLAGTIEAGAEPDAFQVTVGIPTADNSSLYQYQAVRIGGDDLNVGISVDAPDVGELVADSGPGQTVSVVLEQGKYATPVSIDTGGVAFSPLSPGEVTVSADIPGFVATGNASVIVNVE